MLGINIPTFCKSKILRTPNIDEDNEYGHWPLGFKAFNYFVVRNNLVNKSKEKRSPKPTFCNITDQVFFFFERNKWSSWESKKIND